MEQIRKRNIVKTKSYIQELGYQLIGSGLVLEVSSNVDYFYVLTAWHCIYEDTSQKKKYTREQVEKITCVTEFDKEIELTAFDWVDDKKRDIAVLKIHKSDLLSLFPDNSIEQVIILDDCKNGQQYKSYGYASVNSDEKQSLNSEFDIKEEGGESFLVKCEPTTFEKTKGFSGSPVFLDDTNYLVGIITHYSPSLGDNKLKGVRLNSLSKLTNLDGWEQIQIYSHNAPSALPKDDFLKGILTFRLLQLLNTENSGLKKLEFEYFEKDRFKEIDDTGERLTNIFVIEYYGSDNISDTEFINFSWINYSLTKRDIELSWKEILDILAYFSKIFNAFMDKYGIEKTVEKLRFSILSNRPELSKIKDHPEFKKEEIGKYLEIEGENIQAFIDLIELDFGTNSTLNTQYGFINYFKGIDEINVINRYSTFHSINSELLNIEKRVYTENNILAILQESYINNLFPTPPAIQLPSNYIEREQGKSIAEQIMQSHERVFCIHAAGGMGKTVIIKNIHKYFPKGTFTIIYDCYGEGTYLNSSAIRHKPENALIQIINEVSLNLGTAFVKKDKVYLSSEFLHCIKSASEILNYNNPQAFLNIVIDAADNSVYAAKNKGQDDFVSELSNIGELPNNCNLIFTARTERQKELNLPPNTKEIPIVPFSEEETKQFLKLKFPDINKDQVLDFHNLTNQTPRIQAYALQNKDTIEKVFDFLKPYGKSMQTMIEGQFEEAKKRFVDKDKANYLLRTIISLPRPLPINYISEITSISIGSIRDFLTDTASGIIVKENQISFRDEDSENYLRNEYPGNVDYYSQIANNFKVKASTDLYAAQHIANILYNANEKEYLYEIVLKNKYLDVIKDPLKQREVFIERTKLALKLSSQDDDNITFLKLLVVAAEASKHNKAQLQLILNNLEIVIANKDIETIRKLFFSITNNFNYGAANWQCSAIYSRDDKTKQFAKKHYLQAEAWLEQWQKLTKRERRDYEIDNESIAAQGETLLRVFGVKEAIADLKRWQPKTIMNSVVSILTRNLIKTSTESQINNWIDKVKRADVLLIVASELIKKGKAIQFNLVALIESLKRIIEKKVELPDSLNEAIITVCEYIVRKSADNKTVLFILEQFPSTLPKHIPTFYGASSYGDGQLQLVDNILRVQLLIYSLKKKKIELQNLYPIDYLDISTKKEKSAKDRLDESKKEFDIFYGYIIQVYQLRLNAFLSKENDDYKKSARSTISTILKGLRYDKPGEIGNILIFCLRKLLDAIHYISDKEGLLAELLSEINSFRDISKINLMIVLARIASIHEETHHFSIELLSKLDKEIIEGNMTATDKMHNYQRCIRICQKMDDSNEAKFYFDKAVEIASGIDIEAFDQIKAINYLTTSLKQKVSNPKLAYELARFTEYSSKQLNGYDHFPWDYAISGIRNIDFGSALSTWCRWEHQNLEFDSDSGYKFWSDNLNIALKHDYITTDTAAGLSFYYLFNYQWLDFVNLILKRFKKENKIEQREIYLQQLSKEIRIFCPLSNREAWLEKIIPILEKHNLHDNPYYKELKEVYDFIVKHNKKEKSNFPTEDRNIDESQLIELSNKIDPTNIAEIYNALLALGESEGYFTFQKKTRFLELLRNNCSPSQYTGHLDALLALDFNEVPFYDFKKLLEKTLNKWQIKKSVVEWKKENFSKVIEITLNKLNDDIYEFNYFDSPSLYQLAEMFNIGYIQLANTLKNSLPRLIENYSAEMIYQTFDIFHHLLKKKEAGKMIRWTLKRWNRRINKSCAEGKWEDTLTPSSTQIENFAQYMRFYLGYQNKSERWRIAHTLRRQIALGDIQVIDYLIENRNETSCFPFQHKKYPFFWISAKLWLFIAIDRIAGENPKAIIKHFETLKNEALQIENGHILIRKFAVSSCIKLIEFKKDVCKQDIVNELKNTLVPSLKKQKRKHRAELMQYDKSKLKFDFNSLDTIPYWFERLGKIFNKSGKEIASMADKYIRDFFKYSGKINNDDYVQKQYYNSRNYYDIYNRQGNVPKVETLGHFYEFHAMMMVANELLYKVLVIKDGYWEGWDYWLNGWTFSWKDDDSNKEGYWLSDLRDSTPLEKYFWDMPIFGKPEEWQFAISSEYIDEVAHFASNNDFYVLKSYYTRYNYKNNEDVHISSALVNIEKAYSLLNALQTIIEPYDFYLPMEGDNDGIIDEFGFKLDAIVRGEDFHTENIDEYDNKTVSLSKGITYPSKELIKWGNLSKSPDGKFFYMNNDTSQIVTKYENWTDYYEKHQYTPTGFGSNGYRFSINKEMLHSFLQQKELCLITECRISRHIENNDYKILNDYTKLYLIYPDGTIRALSGNIKLR